MSIALIKELRQRTGAGMMDCKKAIQENNGNVEEAIKWLRERGIAKAAKKAGAIAAEGITIAKGNANRAVLMEINSQTDFVAKNAQFQAVVTKVSTALLNSTASNLEEALTVSVEGKTVAETLVEATATIGEKLSLRRFHAFSKTDADAFGVYNHSNSRISSVVVLKGTTDSATAKQIAMHSSAMNPKFLSEEHVDQAWLATEKDVLTQQALAEGKPAAIVDKMIVGRIKKLLKEICLVDQKFVINPDVTVAQAAKSTGGTIAQAVRLEVGEGIEKKVDDFAAEVAAQMGN